MNSRINISRFFFLFIVTVLAFTSLYSQENSATLCADGIDNDNDGLIDCQDPNCLTFSSNGCQICSDGISFADEVLFYESGCTQTDPLPEGALGVSDYAGSSVDAPDFVFLGQGGSIKLGFTNNLISNSGDNQEDVYIFEVGPAVEAMSVALRPADTASENAAIAAGLTDEDADGYYEFGDIGGATSTIDIDEFIPSSSAASLFFDAIELTDIIDGPCGSSSAPGADIDAVCAIFFTPVGCAGEPGESVTPLSSATCNDDNGSAEVLTGVGTPPFTFLWDNGETGQIATELTAGTHMVTVTEASGCSNVLTVEVDGEAAPMASISTLEPAGCESNNGSASVEPTSGEPPFTYAWDNGESTPTATALNAGEHSVTLTDANGCSVVLTTEVAETPLPEAILEILAPASCDLDNGIAEIITESGTPPFSILWDNGETTQTATALDAGEHSVTLTDANNCTITINFTIMDEEQLPAPIINSNGLLCADSTVTLSTLAQQGVEYLWSLPNGSEVAGAELVIGNLTPADMGSYTVFASSSGCNSASEPFELMLDTSRLDLADSLFVCDNSTTISSPILASVYSWSNGSDSIFTTAPITGNYGLTITTNNGCILNDSTYVTLVEAPQIELDSVINVAECQQVFIEARNLAEEQLFFSWTDDGSFQVNCDGCPNIQFFPDSSGTIFLETTSAEFGCTRMDSVGIRLIPNYDIYIPNSFSPNRDGVNDGFTVFAKNDATRITKMEIYSRWGELLFQETDLPVNRPALGWPGDFIRGDNRPMKPGVYVYQITITFIDGTQREYAGNVHLIR